MKKEDILENLTDKVAEKDISRMMKSLSVTFERVGIGFAIGIPAALIIFAALLAFFVDKDIKKENENRSNYFIPSN